MNDPFHPALESLSYIPADRYPPEHYIPYWNSLYSTGANLKLEKWDQDRNVAKLKEYFEVE